MKITKEQVQDYFEIMVENQPETVVEILMQLISREVSIDDWITNTIDDVIDSLQRINELGFQDSVTYIQNVKKINN